MGTSDRYTVSRALYRRAQDLIPGGIHLSGRPLLDQNSSPLYFERGRGSRIWDADGNEYIDFVMAYGPYLLGYAHPEVDRAAAEQGARGSLLSLNHPLHLSFIETLLRHFPAAEMGIFFKTGSEATTAAVRIARRATGRRAIARCGYHGWHDWCLPAEDFVPEGLTTQIFVYDAMRPETLSALLDERRGQFAAVILAPEMIHPPSRETMVAVIEAAHRHGALFIMDEVKTGLRAPRGSMQAFYGVEPDMTTLSKALGNGWPVAAVIGPRAVMAHAAGMHLSATYHGDTSAMAAALATLEIVERNGVQETVWALGQQLIQGLNEAARRNQIPAEAYGEPIPPMPFLRFTHPDPARNEQLKSLVYAKVIAEGILLHPRHMWFISAAHDAAEIGRAVEVVDAAMCTVAARNPDLLERDGFRPKSESLNRALKTGL
ncbi:MAG: aminotransferase class III-fold pyridoxal phosphate-dependent enzyme [Acetobacteraceae bacterium]|nr:aminotransferase class III-fold pyridoxal phosphate-dependent enzyme [Acetobacteraceae bacterium]